MAKHRMRFRQLIVFKLLLLLFLSFVSPCSAREKQKLVRNVCGTYGGAPRLPNRRVDVDRLVTELVELRVNTYNWLIFFEPTDWDDLKLFLPKAREKKINVWVTLVPPSESKPHSPFFSEPFRLDYARWGTEIATLSAHHSNLVAWSIDDFGYDLDTFTPEFMEKTLAEMRAVNPRLAFIPCCYYSQLKPKLIATYGKFFDAVLFPYRAESSGKPNTSDGRFVAAEVTKVRQRLGHSIPVILDVYATKHSKHPVSTPQYVCDVMRSAHRSADGVMIYCHQDKKENPEKYAVINQLFNSWSQPRLGFKPPKY